MFTFKQTRMLKEATLAGREPFSTGKLIGFFFLVFLIATLGQSLILAPAQVIAWLTGDAFRPIVEDSSLSISEKINALTTVGLPSWVMTVQLFSTVAIVIACLVFCRSIEKRNLVSMGFVKKGAASEYLVGLGIGLFMLTAAVLLCVITGQAELGDLGDLSSKPWGMILLFLGGYLIQGLSEEMLCRSLLMVSLSRGRRLWTCILTNALIFAALHIFNPGITPLALLNITLFGIFASVYTLRRGSIWGIAAIHSMWNFTQGNIFGIAVSGMGDNPTVWHWNNTMGAWWFNGGSFGLEGGLAVTAVLVMAIWLTLMTPTKSCEIFSET